MPFLALLGLWGVAELVALIAVVAKIGFFATLGLLILSSAIGSWLLRSQQQAVLRMAETPGRDVARESVYRMTAGVLLLGAGAHLPGAAAARALCGRLGAHHPAADDVQHLFLATTRQRLRTRNAAG